MDTFSVYMRLNIHPQNVDFLLLQTSSLDNFLVYILVNFPRTKLRLTFIEKKNEKNILLEFLIGTMCSITKEIQPRNYNTYKKITTKQMNKHEIMI